MAEYRIKNAASQDAIHVETDLTAEQLMGEAQTWGHVTVKRADHNYNYVIGSRYLSNSIIEPS